MFWKKTEEYYQKLRESVNKIQEEARAEQSFGGVRYRNPRPPMDIPEMGRPKHVPLEGATASAVNNEFNPVYNKLNPVNPVNGEFNPANNIMPPILTD